MVAPATVVKGSQIGSQMFPRDRVMASLKKYDIEYSDSEETEELRLKWAKFYASRTLTNEPITPEGQAEAIYFLASAHGLPNDRSGVHGGWRATRSLPALILYC